MVRQHWGLDWAASLEGSIRQEAEALDYTLAASWPLLRGLRATIYEWSVGYRLVVLEDAPALSMTNVAGSPVPRPCPVDNPEPPTVANVGRLADEVEVVLGLRRQDFAFFVRVIEEATSLDDDWERSSEDDRALWWAQLSNVVNRYWYFMKGFDVDSGFVIPPGYAHLADACRLFLADHPDYERNVFLMTRLGDDKHLRDLDDTLRAVLRSNGLDPVRADDRVYPADRNLWGNVCVYMICCSKGVAILEDRTHDEFNPNVAIEYGFMRALNKAALLLADTGFRNLRADIIGTLREEFDLLDIERTVPPAIERWLRDIGYAAEA